MNTKNNRIPLTCKNSRMDFDQFIIGSVVGALGKLKPFDCISLSVKSMQTDANCGPLTLKKICQCNFLFRCKRTQSIMRSDMYLHDADYNRSIGKDQRQCCFLLGCLLATTRRPADGRLNNQPILRCKNYEKKPDTNGDSVFRLSIAEFRREIC